MKSSLLKVSLGDLSVPIKVTVRKFPAWGRSKSIQLLPVGGLTHPEFVCPGG